MRQTLRTWGFTQDGEIPCKTWYNWLEEMKKKDEKEKMEEMHQHKMASITKSAVESAGLLHKISKPTAPMGGAQIEENEEEDARLLDRCEAKRKEWARLWQCDEGGAERGGKAVEE